jgi:hypothetical protein
MLAIIGLNSSHRKAEASINVGDAEGIQLELREAASFQWFSMEEGRCGSDDVQCYAQVYKCSDTECQVTMLLSGSSKQQIAGSVSVLAYSRESEAQAVSDWFDDAGVRLSFGETLEYVDPPNSIASSVKMACTNLAQYKCDDRDTSFGWYYAVQLGTEVLSVKYASETTAISRTTFEAEYVRTIESFIDRGSDLE